MFKKKSSRALAAGLASAVAIGALAFAAVPASAKVLATVNGQPITDEDLKIATEDLGPSLPQQIQGKARESMFSIFSSTASSSRRRRRPKSSTRPRISPTSSPITTKSS